jgi:hypothetical protein
MRRQLVTDNAGVLDPHDHVAWYGDGIDDLYSVASVALAAGARRNEKLLFVAEEPDPARLHGIGELEYLLSIEQLELLAIDAVYGTRKAFSASAQLETFEQVLAGALASGYRGIRVVADNTPLVRADDEAFRRWLAWEQLTDRFQAGSMVTGVCYFDRGALSEERQADLAAIHPVRSASSIESPFTLYADGDAIRVIGALDVGSNGRFARLLDINPFEGPLVVDLSAADSFDQQALLVLAEAASVERPIRVRARSPARDLLSLLERARPHLRFEVLDGEPIERELGARLGQGLIGLVPTCAQCGVVIGVYEPTTIVVNGEARGTSRAAEPDAVDAAAECYHRGCYADTPANRGATKNRDVRG